MLTFTSFLSCVYILTFTSFFSVAASGEPNVLLRGQLGFGDKPIPKTEQVNKIDYRSYQTVCDDLTNTTQNYRLV